MSQPLSRRAFLTQSAAVVGTAGLVGAQDAPRPLFEISLAQWSHNKAFFGRGGVAKKDPLEFAEIAKTQYDISAVEYVNQFYREKKTDQNYLRDLKKVADDNRVRSVLIMCDGEGNLGNPDEKARITAVDNHKRWFVLVRRLR